MNKVSRNCSEKSSPSFPNSEILTDIFVEYYATLKGIEGLEVISQGRQRPIGIIMPKKSPLLPILAPMTFKLYEQGIVTELKKQYLRSPSNSAHQEMLSLSVGQTLLAILTLGGGLSLAGAVFCVEMIVFRKWFTIQF